MSVAPDASANNTSVASAKSMGVSAYLCISCAASIRMSGRPLTCGVLACLAAAVAIQGQGTAVDWRRVHAGVEHIHFTRPAPGGGTWNINALRVDLTQVRLDVIRALDAAVGLERVSSMAARTGAIAAVNGGYFRTSGDFLGESTGTLQIDHVLWSEPDRGRASVGIIREGGSSRLIFGHVQWRASIEAGGQTHAIDGVNRARGADELIVFMPRFGPAPVTDATGMEVVVRGGRVVDAFDNAGRTPIPADGFVVSARGVAREWARRALTKGARVALRMTLVPADRWQRVEDVVGAGPKLVTGGRVDVTDEREKMVPTFRTETHPRTAIASLADGRALLLVADGRHPPERVGLALDDLARLLIDLGAREAINLDGGGSSAMVVRGGVVNYPSDASGERPVSDAIIVRGK